MKDNSRDHYEILERKAFYDGVFLKQDIQGSRTNHRQILNALSLKPGLKYLDISCGSGHLLNEASRYSLQRHGGDLSPVALIKAKKTNKTLSLTQINGEKLPYKDNVFDRISNCGSLEHYQSPAQGISEIARTLKPGGVALIIVPNSYQWRHWLSIWKHGELEESWQKYDLHLSKNEWIKLISKHGLNVIKTSKFEKSPQLIELKHNKLKVKSFKKYLRDLAANYIFPLNFTDQFLFLCKKQA